MLVLTRRIGEQIVIGNDIRVTIVNVGPGRVKIGIEAPHNVRVDRAEVHERIAQEQTVAPAPAVSEEANPLIVDGQDEPKLHNRIADKLPTGGVTETPIPTGVNRITKHRLPRKPR